MQLVKSIYTDYTDQTFSRAVFEEPVFPGDARDLLRLRRANRTLNLDLLKPDDGTSSSARDGELVQEVWIQCVLHGLVGA